MADKRWRKWREVSGVFAGPADPHWAADRERVDNATQDPWAS